MASRLKTRISAGAALVTGIGMMGIASAAPAQAAVTGSLAYTCGVANEGLEQTFDDPWNVDLTFDVPEQVEAGATIPAGAITAEVTPGEDATERIQSLNVTSLEGSGETSYTFGDGESRDVVLEVAQTDVPAEGGIAVTATGTSVEETAPAEDGKAPIVAGDFTADLANQDGFIFNIECTAPDDGTVANITVGEDGEGDNGTDEPGEGDNDTPGEGDNDTDTPGEGDNGAGEPEVPGVVQTDDMTQSNNAAAIALGGLLFAGVGAGLVTVARRRQAQN